MKIVDFQIFAERVVIMTLRALTARSSSQDCLRSKQIGLCGEDSEPRTKMQYEATPTR